MKKLIIKGLCALAIASTAATAFAYTDSEYIAIGRLEASSGTSGSYRVYPASGFSLPAVCEKNDFAEAQAAGPTATERDQMNRLLMSAFMSSRLVKLRLDGCEASNKRPLYRIVTVNLEN
jgi:hypothetical protein